MSNTLDELYGLNLPRRFLRKPEDSELLVRTIATLREDREQMGVR